MNRRMDKGFTLTELMMTVVVLSVLSGFAFSVVWQYSHIYADTRGGYVYGEAATVLERMTRELRDADQVDPLSPNPGQYINFSLKHGTPATGGSQYWVQYCVCSAGGHTLLYRVQDVAQGAPNQCQGVCPTRIAASLMSRSLMSSGFQVLWVQNDLVTSDDDSYEITLQLASRGSPSTSPRLRPA